MPQDQIRADRGALADALDVAVRRMAEGQRRGQGRERSRQFRRTIFRP
jgi:hypothetical protein